MNKDNIIIDAKNVKKTLGGRTILQDINLQVYKGEVLAIVGGSGSGKTTLLRQLLALSKPDSGSIKVFDTEITTADSEKLLEIQRRWGVLFQQNALFSSLNLLDNVAFPLREHTDLKTDIIYDLALLRILMAGLSENETIKLPEELSGGMRKRAGVARAIVLDPELIFLDEPTSGLDPETADEFDDLIMNLQQTMGLTVVMVTHDIDSLWKVSNRVAFLADGKILAVAPIEEMVKNPEPKIQHFFNGPRGRAAQGAGQTNN